MGSKGGFSLTLEKELDKVQALLKPTKSVHSPNTAVGRQHNFQGNPLLAGLTIFLTSLLRPLDRDAASLLNII